MRDKHPLRDRQMTVREMDQAEDVHALAAHVGRHLARLRQEDSVHRMSGDDGMDARWLALSDDHLQQGFMCLLRAIERPHSY